jgi:hypothetical protein
VDFQLSSPAVSLLTFPVVHRRTGGLPCDITPNDWAFCRWLEFSRLCETVATWANAGDSQRSCVVQSIHDHFRFRPPYNPLNDGAKLFSFLTLGRALAVQK